MKASMPSLHAVAIAGGSGTRFWPLSRRERPKQLIRLDGEVTLLEGTFKRILPICPPQRMWMVIGKDHAKGCIAAAPFVSTAHTLIEPQGRNTAPAIALAALAIAQEQPEGVMVILPADHHVADPNRFCQAVATAYQAAKTGLIVTLGIKPTQPETGFGYIEQADPLAEQADVYHIERFCEKPDKATAEQFVASGRHFWNAGIFVMRVDTYLEEVRRFLPHLTQQFAPLEQGKISPHDEQGLATLYSGVQPISIDYGIMEHSKRSAVVPVDCGWSDVGSFAALGAVLQPDGQGNLVRGKAYLQQCRDCVVWVEGEHTVALRHLEQMIVVHTPDVSLMLPRQDAQSVKLVLEGIQAQGWADLC